MRHLAGAHLTGGEGVTEGLSLERHAFVVSARSELVDEANSGLIGFRLIVELIVCRIDLILKVAKVGINKGTLGERIFVASTKDKAGDIDLAARRDSTVCFRSIFGIHVTNHGMSRAGESRHRSTERQAVTVIVAVKIGLVVDLCGPRTEQVTDLAVLKVANGNKGFDHTEVIRTAHRNTIRVIDITGRLGSGVIRLLIDRINNTDNIEAANGVGGTESRVTVRGRLVFVTVFTEGVLGVDLEARKIRRDIGQHVVITRIETGAPEQALVTDITPTSAERVEVANGIGASRTIEDANAARGQRTEVARYKEVGFAVKKLIRGLESAVVRVEAVLKNEADLHAIAEVFSGLQTKAVARGVARGHFELGDIILIGNVSINIGIANARVDTTIELNISSLSGESNCAENGNSNERFLEHGKESQRK